MNFNSFSEFYEPTFSSAKLQTKNFDSRIYSNARFATTTGLSLFNFQTDGKSAYQTKSDPRIHSDTALGQSPRNLARPVKLSYMQCNPLEKVFKNSTIPFDIRRAIPNH